MGLLELQRMSWVKILNVHGASSLSELNPIAAETLGPRPYSSKSLQ